MTISQKVETIMLLLRGLDASWSKTDWKIKRTWISKAIKEMEILKSIVEAEWAEGVDEIHIPQLDMEGKPFK